MFIMVAFANAISPRSAFAGAAVSTRHVACPRAPRKAFGMSTEEEAAKESASVPASGAAALRSLAPHLKNNSVVVDGRYFKVSYSIPIEGRSAINFREPTFACSVVSFADLYNEQVRIHKSGRKILSVEKVSGA